MIENFSVNPQDANDFVTAVFKSIGGAIKKGWEWFTTAIEKGNEIKMRSREIEAGVYRDNATNSTASYAADEKFEIDTSAVLTTATEVSKLATKLKTVRDRVSGYDVSNEDGFDFAGAKNQILTNIDNWINKIGNTEKYIKHVASEHELLQKKMADGAPDFSYMKRLLEKDVELESGKTKDNKSSTVTIPPVVPTPGGNSDTTPDTTPGETTPDTTPGETTPDTTPGETTPDTTPGETTPDTTPNPDETPGENEKTIDITLGKAGFITTSAGALAGLGAASLAILSNTNLRYNSDGYAMIGNRYLVQCDSSLGEVGDAITLVRSDKTHVDCLIASTTDEEEGIKFYVNDEFDEKNLIDVTKTEKVVNYGPAEKLEKQEEPKVEPEPKSEPDPEPKSEPDPEPKSEPDPEPKSEPDPEPKSEPDPEPKSDPTPEPEQPPQQDSTPAPQESYDDHVEGNYNSNNNNNSSEGTTDNSSTDTTDSDDFEDETEEDEEIYDVKTPGEDDTTTTNNTRKKSSVGPVLAGLGLAGAAGVGAKIMLDKKKENDEEDDEEEDEDEYDDSEYDDGGFVEPNSDQLVTDSYDDNDNFTYKADNSVDYNEESSNVDIMNDNNTINNVYSIRDDDNGDVGSIDDKLNALSNIDGDQGNDNFSGSFY